MGSGFIAIPQKDGKGQVMSAVMKSAEIQEFATFFFETDLTLEKGQSVVKSQIFQMRNPHLTKWRLELYPNFMHNDTRYLAFWVRLLESEKEEVNACFAATLITTPTDMDYEKVGGLFCYSLETPCHGFPKFIPMYRLQSNGNPLVDRFRFRVKILLFSPLLDQVNQMGSAVTTGPTHINLDATLTFNGNTLKVDSRKLSLYSSVFRSRFKDKDLTADASEFLELKCMAERVVGFCHTGTLPSVPKQPTSLEKLINVSDSLGIPMLKDACQKRYLENLKPKYFAETVELWKVGLLDEKEAMPMLMDFLLKHFDEVIGENNKYQEAYGGNKDLHSRYILGKPSGGG